MIKLFQKIKCLLSFHLFLDYYFLTENKIKIHKCTHCGVLKFQEVNQLIEIEDLLLHSLSLWDTQNIKISGDSNFLTIENDGSNKTKLNCKLNGRFKIVVYGKRK